MSRSESGSPFQVIPLKQIHPGNNPRDDWDNQAVGNLAASIKATGGRPLQPLVVRSHPDKPGEFEIICGERRYRAAKQAKLTSVECVVRQCDSITALELALQENLNRKDLNPLQIAKVLEELCKPVKEGGAGYSSAQAAARFGKTNSWCKNVRRLLKLPEFFQAKIASGEMGQSAVRTLVPHADDQAFLAQVETDMKANPWAYRTREDFTRSVELLKSGEANQVAPPIKPKRELPAAVGAAPTPSRSPAAARGRATIDPPSIDDLDDDAEAPPAADTRRAMDPREAQPTLVERAVALIEGMQTLEELNAIQRVVNRVRQHVHQASRTTSKAAG